VNLDQLKVSTRLSLAFGALVLVIATMAGLTLFEVERVAAAEHSLVAQRMPRMAAINRIKDHVNQIGLSMRNMVIMTGADDLAKLREQVLGEHAATAALLTRLAAEIDSERGKSLLSQLGAARATYEQAQTRYLELATTSRSDEAKAFLIGTARPLQLAYFAGIDALLEYQNELARGSAEEASATVASIRVLVPVMSGIALLIAIGAAVWIVRSLMRQLGGDPMQAVALATAVAQGDLSSRIALREGDTQSMMAQLQRMQEQLAGVVGQVRSNADSVATASGQIAQGNADLSQRTEEQASALEETAASMEQLGVTVRQNADHARQASQLAEGASAVAGKGGEVVAQVVQTMKGIQGSSQRIAEIIGTIDGIAFQTNILALNAAVEAARAGEQGRGFAVVAGEVRALAQRSAEAAKEIKHLITDSVEQVDAGTALADQAGSTMQEIVSSIGRVTDIMGEISSASVEQSQGVSQVGEAVSQMDQVTQQNAALVEQSAAAADSLKQQALQLARLVSVFKVDASPAADAAAARLLPR
jgi:methyl-accepting chemotaxis protein